MTARVHRYVDRLIDDLTPEERLCHVCGASFWGVAGLCLDCRKPAPEYRKKEAK